MRPAVWRHSSGPVRRLVGGRVGRVGVLVGHERARRRLGQAPGHRVVRVGVGRVHGRRADHHLGAVGPQQGHLLGGDLVRHGENAAVAAASGHDGQSDPGVARGRFDDGAAPPQQAVGLGGLDHGQGRPVLDAAARVEELELGQQLAGQVPADAVHPDQRGVADQLDQGVGGFDGRTGIGDPDGLDARPGVDREVACRWSPAGRPGAAGEPRPPPGRCRPVGGDPDHADRPGDVGPEVGDGS